MDIDKRGIDPSNASRPLQRPVFDIARPRPAAASSTTVPVTPAPAPAASLQDNSPAIDTSAPPASVPTGTVISPNANSNVPITPLFNTSKAQPPKKKKRSKKPLIMLMATLVVLGGAGGSYYFLTMRDKAAPVAQTDSTEAADTEPTTTTTAGDIDTTTTEIDSAINGLDDTQDFQESDFSDETLGL